MDTYGATAVITHHIIDGRQAEYESWLEEIAPLCKNAPGNIDWQIIRPIPSLTFAYTVIIRFDTIEHLTGWMESDARKTLVKQAAPLLAKDDKYYLKTGMDFLFLSPDEQPKVPVRWKQYLVTWSAIYPLSLLIPLLILPVLRWVGVPAVRYIDAFFVSGTIVCIMIYALMPQYTRLIRKWLYK